MTTKYQPRQVHRVNIAGTMFPYDDATENVTITRSLMDVFKGRPGEAGACMNAQCVMRNKSHFPHKVLGVSVVKSRVYVIDSPDHVVRYTLSEKDAVLIASHDEKAIGEPGTLVLRAPTGNHRKGLSNSSSPGSMVYDPKKKRYGKGAPLRRGEKARVKAAVGVA